MRMDHLLVKNGPNAPNKHFFFGWGGGGIIIIFICLLTYFFVQKFEKFLQ